MNQVGYETGRPKRFTAPLSPDGSKFEVRLAGTNAALFGGEMRSGIGDFTSFHPADTTTEYEVVVTGGTLYPGKSDPFAIRKKLYREQFWQGALDFMMDARSVAGTHPSAYGGCPWRDGTYYDYIVPSLDVALAYLEWDAMGERFGNYLEFIGALPLCGGQLCCRQALPGRPRLSGSIGEGPWNCAGRRTSGRFRNF